MQLVEARLVMFQRNVYKLLTDYMRAVRYFELRIYCFSLLRLKNQL